VPGAELPAAAAVLGACLIGFEGRTLRLRKNAN